MDHLISEILCVEVCHASLSLEVCLLSCGKCLINLPRGQCISRCNWVVDRTKKSVVANEAINERYAEFYEKIIGYVGVGLFVAESNICSYLR